MRTEQDINLIATQHMWRVNPNKKLVRKLIEQENAFFKEHQKYYCPCKISHTPENECPCQNAQTEIDQKGHCHCQLFLANS